MSDTEGAVSGGQNLFRFEFPAFLPAGSFQELGELDYRKGFEFGG